MKVNTFASLYVPLMFRGKFWDLMEQWDGRKDVYGAFYDLDVLKMKAKEAKEFAY